MAHGALTAQVARVLLQELDPQGFDVLYDHGLKGVDPPNKLGKLRSWFGPGLKSETVLADLDIAVVSRDTGKTHALIEIEETTDKPKVILGDILATLLGNGIAFQGKGNLLVGEWTTLIVLVQYARQPHLSRVTYLAEQANNMRAKLSTPNASIARIVLDTFSDKAQLEHKLRQHIANSVGH